MKPENDAYGQEVWEFFQGKEDIVEIVERDDGYVGTSSGPAAYFRPFAEWPTVEQEAAAYAHGRILDIGCGPGRVCLHFQEQGHEVVGIDNSPLAIKTAQARGVLDTRLMSITQTSRKALGMFDTLVMFGNNFGLMGSYRRAKWLLRRFYGMTPVNGRILAESLNPYDTDDAGHKAYHARNRQRGRMGGQVRIRVRYRTVIGPWFNYLLVSPTEMADIVQGTGWRIATRLQSENQPFYVAVLEKES